MWRLVREGVRFYRAILLVSWAFSIGIFGLILVLLAILGWAHGAGALLKVAVQVPLPILISSMIACFIAVGTERGENRVRLHAVLPVPLRQVALARVLLPTTLMLAGVVLAHVLFALMLAIEGSPPLSPRHLNVAFNAVLFLFGILGALAIREVIELRQRVHWSRVLGSVVVLALAVAFLVVVQAVPFLTTTGRVALIAALDVGFMAFTVVLFERRTSFTK